MIFISYYDNIIANIILRRLHMANFDNAKLTAIEKSFHVLECFIPYNNELSNTEISQITGFNIATASRILKALKKSEYLYQNPSNKKYSLGKKIIMLNSAKSKSLISNLVLTARQYLLDLRNATNQTVVMDIIINNTDTIALAFQGSGDLSFNVPIGLPVEWNTASGLQAMLAYSNLDRQQIFFSQPMIKKTKNSITDLGTYKAALIEVQENSYAFAVDEPMEGAASLSLPVFDYSHTPVAAVSVMGLKETIIEKKDFFLNELRIVADKLTNFASMN